MVDSVEQLGTALTMQKICKSFGGNQVLTDVDLTLHSGEVHALVGMNGSGKSTLIKILAHVYQTEGEGSITFPARVTGGAGDEGVGRRRWMPTFTTAQFRPSVGFVHQDLALIPDFSLLDNFALTFGYETTPRGTVSVARLREKVLAGLARVGVDADPEAPLSQLGAAERSLFAIARALEQLEGVDAPVLVLDEPTAALPVAESRRVADVMRQLVHDGAAILFVSHHLDEVMTLSHRVSVLRDGHLVLRANTAETTKSAIVDAMLGEKAERTLEAQHQRREQTRDDSTVVEGLLTVRELTSRRVENVSFDVGHGEILAITGLVGCGKSEVGRIVAGSRAAVRGQMTLGGADYAPGSPGEAIKRGVGYVPAERLTGGGISTFDLRENVSLPVLGQLSRRGIVQRRAEVHLAQRFVDATRVAPARVDLPFQSYSGGNQQKIVLSRALASEPRLGGADEPTQGVDVSAIPVIYEQLRKVAASGASVLVLSSSYEEVVELADRAIVMDRGVVTAELRHDELTVAALLAAPAAHSTSDPHHSGADHA